MIVEIRDGSSEAVMSSLANIANVSVFGIKDNQIVAVIEGSDPVSVDETMKALFAIEDVTGVYPVYAGDYE